MRALRRTFPGGAAPSSVLRAAAALAALAAAWNPAFPGARGPALRVLLRDVSASAGDPRDEAGAALVAGLGAADRVAVVAFAEEPAVVGGPCAPAEIRTGGALPSPWGTSLAKALRTAAALRRDGERLELVLDSDLRFTDAPAALDDAVAAVLSAGGAELVALPPREAPERGAVVLSASGPGRVFAGEEFAIDVEGIADRAGTPVTLTCAGAVVETRRVGAPGPFRISFRRTAGHPGTEVFEALAAPGVPGAGAAVVVAEPGAIAVLHAGNPRPALAAAAGAAAGGQVTTFDVRTADAQGLSRAIDGHDAVVVDDCAGEIAAQGPILAFASGGGGLVLLAGTSSAAAGPASRQAAELDAVSPIRSAPPGDAACVFYLGIDGSGSMAEPWPGTTGGLARDAAARAAADALVRAVPDGTLFFLRRFREFLVPPGPVPEITLSGEGRGVAAAAIRALPTPGGSTAFLPVLAEAYDVLGGRPGRPRAVAVVSDGQSSEDLPGIRAALRRLTNAGVRVTVIVPGDLPADVRGAPLLGAAAASGVAVRPASDPAALSAALADAERSARTGEPFVAGRPLEITAAGAARLRAADVPSRAARLVRAWDADDAEILVRTPDGLPVAGLRACGAGCVAAVAARVPDERWLDGDGGSALLAALVRLVRRRGAADVRISRDAAGITARIDLPPASAAPGVARFLRSGATVALVPLRPEAGDLWSVPAPPDADTVRFEAAGGTLVASAGLERPAPAELADVPVADVSALAARLRAPAESRGPRCGPAFGALAVALLVAGSASRRKVKLPSRPIR